MKYDSISVEDNNKNILNATDISLDLWSEYCTRINYFIQLGAYSRALASMIEFKEQVTKSEWTEKMKIYFSTDWEEFILGMLCCEMWDDNLSGIGGCGGCCTCLCISTCLCYCCTGGDLGAGCDCMANGWNGCGLVDIMCGKSCEC